MVSFEGGLVFVMVDVCIVVRFLGKLLLLLYFSIVLAQGAASHGVHAGACVGSSSFIKDIVARESRVGALEMRPGIIRHHSPALTHLGCLHSRILGPL